MTDKDIPPFCPPTKVEGKGMSRMADGCSDGDGKSRWVRDTAFKAGPDRRGNGAENRPPDADAARYARIGGKSLVNYFSKSILRLCVKSADCRR
jgi:hypothetical protein